ncbi:MAG TPA: hypothetical protein VEM32_01145 [Geobacteraceae bacterium]|nr:hypothetical protein [Geobacteraceae bacterium]
MAITWSKRLLLALSFLGAAANGWGADLHGRSSSQLLWFNDFYNGRQIELAEYLRVSVTNLDKNGKYSLYGYGRGSQDFTNGEGTSGRLYYLYGEFRDIYEKLDVKLGRQFVNYAAGSALIDGAEVSLKNVGPVAFSVFGGRDVAFGVNGGELTHEGDYALGLGAYLRGFPKTDLEVSWFRKWDQGDVSRDLVGATVRQYLFGRVKLYGNARYDLVSEVFNEVLAGAKYFPTANLVLTGEWFQSYPTFDTTSIYSVFAVDRFQEWVFRTDYTINDKIAVYGGYSRESYGDGGNADVYQVGCKVRPIESLIVDLSYDKRQGYGGNMDGGIMDVLWDVTKQLQLAGGFTYDVFTRQFFPNGAFDDTAQKYWLGGKYKLAKNMAASLRIEDDINALYNNNVQGRFIFDYDF